MICVLFLQKFWVFPVPLKLSFLFGAMKSEILVSKQETKSFLIQLTLSMFTLRQTISSSFDFIRILVSGRRWNLRHIGCHLLHWIFIFDDNIAYILVVRVMNRARGHREAKVSSKSSDYDPNLFLSASFIMHSGDLLHITMEYSGITRGLPASEGRDIWPAALLQCFQRCFSLPRSVWYISKYVLGWTPQWQFWKRCNLSCVSLVIVQDQDATLAFLTHFEFVSHHILPNRIGCSCDACQIIFRTGCLRAEAEGVLWAGSTYHSTN